MIVALTLSSLSIVLLIAGTGLYTQVPGLNYICFLLLAFVIALDGDFRSRPFDFIGKNLMMGYLALNVFFLVQFAASRLDFELFLFQLNSLGAFLLVFTAARIAVNRHRQISLFSLKWLEAVIVLALCIMLLGQLAQVFGFIQRVNYEESTFEVFAARARPGGFLNPNETAAIAVVCLFTLYRTAKHTRTWSLSAGVPISIIVVLLTQSRSGLAALALATIFIVAGLKIDSKKIILIFILFFGFFAYSQLGYVQAGLVNDFLESIRGRIDGDESSAERAFLIRASLDLVGESPFFGGGGGILEAAVGAGAHNQVADFLIGYGVVGSFIVMTALALLYLPSSAAMIAVCILPTFLFSHNFVTFYSFQVLLAVAVVIERADRLIVRSRCFGDCRRVSV